MLICGERCDYIDDKSHMTRQNNNKRKTSNYAVTNSEEEGVRILVS
jgi:hypothetical protein